MYGLAGVTASDVSTAAPTVRGAEPVTPSSAATMLAEPGATPVATPCDPAALETDANEFALEDQMTWLVRFCVESLLNVPTAVNASVSPLGMLALADVTEIEVELTGAVTTNGSPPSLMAAPG